MKWRTFPVLIIAALLFCSFTDEVHYSRVIGMERTFRVFTPLDYHAEDPCKRYPVIYYFHGCRGSYDRDGFTSYSDGDTIAPLLPGRPSIPDYNVPYNADFERYSDLNDVIIVAVDGKIPGFDGGGCGVYYPYHHERNWDGNEFNFSLYIRELFQTVDSRYNTVAGPQGKAITGLSYGGHSSMWVSACNPHLISSCSQFNHSPHHYRIGPPPITTSVNVQELWRNFRGVPFRSSTNTLDYLRYFSEETAAAFTGAGFESEEHLADFCRHWAADIPEQFDFHMKHFKFRKQTPDCFSFINLYPGFDIWGYQVKTGKTEEGWTYMRDVTDNGLGLYTRFSFPFGKPCGNYDIWINTPPNYIPGESYTLGRYSYETGLVEYQLTRADNLGRLKIFSEGGKGEEIGINGPGLEPPVLFLSDTLFDKLHIEDGKTTPLSIRVINLSPEPIDSVVFSCSSDNETLGVLTSTEAYQLQPGEIRTLNKLLTLKGGFSSPNRNVAYLHLGYSLSGKTSQRERIIQVQITDSIRPVAQEDVLIFDGRSIELAVYRYDWGDWDRLIRKECISEGSGNGNGIAEAGESFSVWIRIPRGADPLDRDTWHPATPMGGAASVPVLVERVDEYLWSTGRALQSAIMSLPTDAHKQPTLSVQTELLRMLPADDCFRGSLDKFQKQYYSITLPVPDR